MNLYLDSSVLLRRLLGQAGSIRVDKSYSKIATSALAEVECLRCLDRVRRRDRWDDGRTTDLREAVFKQLEVMQVVEVTQAVLHRASQPMPTELGTLDAIHLATALLWREHFEEELTVGTHDRALAAAARASGLSVVGV